MTHRCKTLSGPFIRSKNIRITRFPKILWVIRTDNADYCQPGMINLAVSAWKSDNFDMTTDSEWLKTFLVGHRNILISQYHGCWWWPGDAMSLCSSRDIDTFLPKPSNLITRKVTFSVFIFNVYTSVFVCLLQVATTPTPHHGLFNCRIIRLHNAITWERHRHNYKNSHNNPKYSVPIYWCGVRITKPL